MDFYEYFEELLNLQTPSQELFAKYKKCIGQLTDMSNNCISHELKVSMIRKYLKMYFENQSNL